MMWGITDRGFLGITDPLFNLDLNHEDSIPLVARLENIPVVLSNWIDGRRVREELVSNLRDVSHLFTDDFFRALSPAQAERLMHLLSYAASAYVYARQETPATHIPSEISVPFVRVANILDRKPILSYASYCLTNWERIDPTTPIQLGNIKLLTNFCSEEYGRRDENWFILVHVEIEAAAARGVAACGDDWFNPEVTLMDIYSSLTWMNRVLRRMPEECSPDNYFRWVRPYIFSFNNIVYEGCFDNQPVTFRGETGAQSSIIPAFLAALGIKHQDSMLTHHLAEMRDYMPFQHRNFLANLEARAANTSLRTIVEHGPASWKQLYNECVQAIIRFRQLHLEYAISYIANKVDNPAGTGGTPYIPWLKQLREETEAFLLP